MDGVSEPGDGSKEVFIFVGTWRTKSWYKEQVRVQVAHSGLQFCTNIIATPDESSHLVASAIVPASWTNTPECLGRLFFDLIVNS